VHVLLLQLFWNVHVLEDVRFEMWDKLSGNLYAAVHDLMPSAVRNTAKASTWLEGAEVAGVHGFSESNTLGRG
jgi:hypothetical protein